jgi:hypothetical protein
MTFKKAEMAKTLGNGLSMIETNPLNHNWLDFAIYSGLALHQYQKNLQLSFWSQDDINCMMECHMSSLNYILR